MTSSVRRCVAIKQNSNRNCDINFLRKRVFGGVTLKAMAGQQSSQDFRLGNKLRYWADCDWPNFSAELFVYHGCRRGHEISLLRIPKVIPIYAVSKEPLRFSTGTKKREHREWAVH